MNPVVSVIVPVFNAESTLGESLSSIRNQTLKELEVICVDDGSTDSSLAILEEFASSDPRFRVLHTEHLGAGPARNAGMKTASGTYLSFLDADDLFAPDMLEKALGTSEKTMADITVFRYRRFLSSDGTVLSVYRFPEFMRSLLQPFPASAAGSELFTGLLNAPWHKLFRTSFIREKNIFFQEVSRYNDLYFTCMALAESGKIALLDEELLRYRKNSGTSLQDTRADDPESCAQAYGFLQSELKKRGLYETFRIAFANSAVMNFFALLLSFPESGGFSAFYRKVREEYSVKFDFSLLSEENAYTRTAFRKYQEMLGTADPVKWLLFCEREDRLSNSILRHRAESSAEYKERLEASRKHREIMRSALAEQRTLIAGLKKKSVANETKISVLSEKIVAQKNLIQCKNQKIMNSERLLRENEIKYTQALKKAVATAGKWKKNRDRILASREYRLGRMVFWLPRKIMSIFRHPPVGRGGAGLKIVLAGLFQENNLGDKVIAQSCRRLVHETLGEKIHHFESLNLISRGNSVPRTLQLLLKIGKILPAVFRNPYKRLVFALHYRFSREGEKLHAALYRADCVIFCGGGLVKYDYMDLWAPIAAVVGICGKKHIPVCFNSVGVENYDPSHPFCRVLAKALNQPCVKVISTRDDLETLQRYLTPENRSKACVAGDPALYAADFYPPAKRSEYIGIGLIRPKAFLAKDKPIQPAEVFEIYAGLVRELDARGIKWKFFTNGALDDDKFAQSLLKKLGLKPSSGVLLPRPEKAVDLVRNIASFRAVAAARLHANIIAASMGIPAAGIVWNDKMTFFSKLTGRSDYFTEGRDLLDSKLLYARLEAAMAHPCDPALIAALKRKTKDVLAGFLEQIPLKE